MPNAIEYFEAGSLRTPLEPDVINEIVRAINPWTTVVGRNGIKVTRGEKNVVIEWVGSGSAADNQQQPPTPPDTGSFQFPWRGQYDAFTDYKKGDLVRRNKLAEYYQGNVVGTYIALKDAPAGSPEPNRLGNAYWDVFAPFACQVFVMKGDNYQQLTVDFSTDKGGILMEQSAGDSTAPSISIDLADTHGEQIMLNLEDICENGTTRQKVFLDSPTI